LRKCSTFHDATDNDRAIGCLPATVLLGREPTPELKAVPVPPGDPDWNQGGTYLAFLRLQIAITDWRQLSRGEQELIVGRDKLTGSPIGSTSVEGAQLQPHPIGAAPLTELTAWQDRDAFINPSDTANAVLEASHINRANQNRGSGSTHAAHRIFRQGYEYLEDLAPDGPHLGLNFMSFQNDLYHVQQILGLSGWLGDANFGGATGTDQRGPHAIGLIALRAGGFYAIPPRETPFAGARLFRE
jgi:deferrochelatase/peroxidase EfeB